VYSYLILYTYPIDYARKFLKLKRILHKNVMLPDREKGRENSKTEAASLKKQSEEQQSESREKYIC